MKFFRNLLRTFQDILCELRMIRKGIDRLNYNIDHYFSIKHAGYRGRTW